MTITTAPAPTETEAQLAPPQPHPLAYRVVGAWVLIALLAVSLVLSLTVGAREITLSELWHFLRSPDPADPVSQVVWQSRVPRTVLILVAGAAFGVAGGLMQAVTRNPLTDPGILGVNAGASLAVVVGIAYFGLTDINQYMWLAFTGATVTSFAVFLIGNAGPMRGNPIRMTLSGVALGAVLGGFTSAVLLTNSDVLKKMRGWSAGTTANQALDNTLAIVPFILIGLVLALALSKSLDVLALGEAAAVAMGANPNRVRLVALIAIALLAGGGTAVAGPISFLGLLAPHLSRMIVGPHQGWIMAYSIILAPAIMGFADVIGRVIVQGEMPVGVVTPFIGAPLLIYMVRQFRVAEL
ncbi:Fe(3+)-siderophore ABC transporter permease [Corynebacterium coyleae]|uniref:FecCD family ABC transporter permease n=1 Tax=Corynebacterium coyleae TaxID=53374 RepID=UPI000C76B926|nr:iron chelate uptake ABC transporter family permease subunit [Corynebacterium coyleae]PLA38969.1 Fe(3+)-siderophore ABC transporter permease [Corynebacterium coyleae]